MSEWISVKDAYPEDYESVLVNFDGGDCAVMLLDYDDGMKWKEDTPYGWQPSREYPSHWMPLPSPPKDDA